MVRDVIAIPEEAARQLDREVEGGLSDRDDLFAHRSREEVERLRERAEASDEPVRLVVDLDPAEKRAIREALGYGEKRHEWLQRAVCRTFSGSRVNSLPPIEQMIERAIRECARGRTRL